MYRITIGSFLFVLFINSCTCWVMTDINYRKLDLDNGVDYGLEDDDLSNEDKAQLRFSLIYPGTKWCGAGNVAADYDDLGTAKEADMCCREHDNCPDLISAGETKYNLTNTAFYTRLHCHCDESFRQCLHNANSTTARRIGKLYFNTLGTKCYRQDYPTIGCSLHGGWFKSKCLEYIYDTNAEQIYQWFDVKNY